MARSSGTYSLPAGQPVVAGTTISDTVFNTLTADIANELTNSIPRDGTAPPTANLPMGNFKITGLANGTVSTDAVAFGQAAKLGANTDITSLTGLTGAISGATDLTTIGNTILGNATTDTLNVGSGGIIKDASGNVGIGAAATAGHKLHVFDTTSIVESEGTAGYGSFYAKGSGTNAAHYFMANATSGEQGRISTLDTGIMTFSNTAAATERFRIGAAGQLGVGGANYGTSGQVLTSQGASSPPVWSGSSRFTSTGNGIASGGVLNLAHGLGAKPYRIITSIICTTADNGYSLGDEIILPPTVIVSGSGYGFTLWVDATNINIRFANTATNCLIAAVKGTGAVATLLNTSWTLSVRAEL